MLPLLLAFLCVVANGFFVAAEFALAKVRPTSLATLADAGDSKAAYALVLTRKLDAYLTATQLGITLASLGLGWLGEPAISWFVEPVLLKFELSEATIHTVSLSIAFSVITAAHIIVGELIPKSIAIQRPEDVSRYTARLLHWFFVLAYPAMWVLNRLSNAALKLMGLPQSEHPEGKLSVEELRLLVRASFPVQHEAKKRDILERVLAGWDRPVRAIMVPRVDVVTLPWAAGIEKCMALAWKHGYSRYPLSENGELDAITGYIYVKDLLVNPVKSIEDLRSRQREILFIPESRSVGNALADFQGSTTPIAVVVDEFGGTAGLVTQEDAIETLVGDLKDELDQEAPRLQMREDGTVTADGSLPLHQLAMAGINLGVDDDESNTVGGAVTAVLGRLPRTGDRLRLGAFDAVIDVRRRRVRRVTLYPRVPTTPPIAEGEPSRG